MAYRANILISNDVQGAQEVQAALLGKLEALELDNEVNVLAASTLGTAAQGVMVVVYPDGVNYVNVTPEDAQNIVEEHLFKGRIVESLVAAAPVVEPLPEPSTKEVRVVLRNVGTDQPREHRRLHHRRWLPGIGQGSHRDDAGAGPRRCEGSRACVGAVARDSPPGSSGRSLGTTPAMPNT